MSAPRLSIIPAGAVTDRSLEPRDLQVLCLFGRHTDKAGWCVRSQVKVAQELGCSRASLQNSIDRLDAAGWLQKKRRDLDVEEAGKRPSRSYAYRVILDRDDYAFDAVTARDDDEPESHAENASDDGGCQQVGTPASPEQHPGANACVGTGATAYVGTKNDPLERPHLERERDARARERTAKFLAAFELRWPTSAVDNRQRTAYAAEGLTEEQQEAALQGIGPFLEDLHKRRGKSARTPAGWRYLEERRWELLGKPDQAATPVSHPLGSPEGRAIAALYGAAGLDALMRATILRHGVLYCRVPITPRVLAFGELPPRDQWPALNRQQAGAWDAFFRETLPNVASRQPIREGVHMPHEFPPRIDGTWSPPTGPPVQPEASEDDLADFR